MISRGNLVLALVLAAQVVLLGALALTNGGTDSRVVEPLARDITASAVQRMTIATSPDDAISVARKGDGWVLPDADDFPVPGDKADEMLGKLLGLDTRRLVASNPANFARLEVKDDDYRRRIELVGAGKSAVIYLGGSGGADTVYARREGEHNVYLGSGLNAWELSTQTAAWVDASYVNIAQDDALEIRVTNANGEITLMRDGETWTLAGLEDGEQFEDTRMPSVLRSAASVRLVEPLGLSAKDEYGLDQPRVKVDVRYRKLTENDASDGDDTEESDEPAYSQETLTLAFGAELDDGTVALKSSGAEYFVSLRETTFDLFAGLSREDFVKASESP